MIWRLLNCGLVAISPFSGFPLTVPRILYISSLCLNREMTSNIWKDPNLPCSQRWCITKSFLNQGPGLKVITPFTDYDFLRQGTKLPGLWKCRVSSVILKGIWHMTVFHHAGNKSVIMRFRTKPIKILKWLNFKRKKRKSSCFIQFIHKYNEMDYNK